MIHKLWNILLSSDFVRVYCYFIYKVILCYFTLIFDQEVITLKKGKRRNKTSFRTKSAARGGGLIPADYCTAIYCTLRGSLVGILAMSSLSAEWTYSTEYRFLQFQHRDSFDTSCWPLPPLVLESKPFDSPVCLYKVDYSILTAEIGIISKIYSSCYDSGNFISTSINFSSV